MRRQEHGGRRRQRSGGSEVTIGSAVGNNDRDPERREDRASEDQIGQNADAGERNDGVHEVPEKESGTAVEPLFGNVAGEEPEDAGPGTEEGQVSQDRRRRRDW